MGDGGQISRNIQQQATLPMMGKEISYCSKERGQHQREAAPVPGFGSGETGDKKLLDDRRGTPSGTQLPRHVCQ